MEDDAFGRCYVACMNRCADGCRRDPAICPGAPGPRSAAGSAPPSAGQPTWSRPTGNSPLPFLPLRPSAPFRKADAGPMWNRCGGGAPRFPSDGGLNAAEAEEGTVGCAGAAMPAGGASGTEAAEEGSTSGTDTPWGVSAKRQIWNQRAEHTIGGKGKWNQCADGRNGEGRKWNRCTVKTGCAQ